MFERYTERARRVLFFARYEASQLGGIAIESEHLLLGLIREGKGLTARIFSRAHLSLETIRKEIEGRTAFREKISTAVEIPFSPEVKRALNFAAEESDRLFHNYIGTEHLLLGILREERCAAAVMLMERGMRLQTVRENITQLLNENPTPTAHAPELPPYIPSRTVHITHSSVSPATDAWIQHAGMVWRGMGFDLAQIVAHAWNVPVASVMLVNPRSRGQRARYDFTIVLPREASDDEITALLREAVQTQLEVEVTPDADGVTVTPVIS